MPIIEISSLDHPGVEIYGTLTEAQLRNRLEPDKGIFIAESPKVIHVALDAGYEPLSLMCERRHITGDAASIIERCGDIPVYLQASMFCGRGNTRISDFERKKSPFLPSRRGLTSVIASRRYADP